MPEENFASLKTEVADYVNQLIDRSSLDLKITVSEPEPDTVAVEFQGFDLPLLLSHNAEVLDAFQYIARRSFAPDVAAGLQIDFDAGGYRHARQQELELMAKKAAERVRTSRVPFVFDPMNAQDRRIIHMAVVDLAGIRTESEGDGQMRRVKILPA